MFYYFFLTLSFSRFQKYIFFWQIFKFLNIFWVFNTFFLTTFVKLILIVSLVKFRICIKGFVKQIIFYQYTYFWLFFFFFYFCKISVLSFFRIFADFQIFTSLLYKTFFRGNANNFLRINLHRLWSFRKTLITIDNIKLSIINILFFGSRIFIVFLTTNSKKVYLIWNFTIVLQILLNFQLRIVFTICFTKRV